MTIFDFIKSEEAAYQTTPVSIADNWDWNMWEHIQKTTLYTNSLYRKGANNGTRPNKNIILPILNLGHRATGFDVKDIELFVNDQRNHYKSFLLRKYHDKWAIDNRIDEFIDDLVESYVDFGGALIKRVKGIPEVVPLQRIAFCDQTDMLSGVIAEKQQLSPADLMDTESLGWGKVENGATIALDELITLALKEGATKTDDRGLDVKTPSRYIEIYELHGQMPQGWMDDSDSQKYTYQMQVVAMYRKEGGERVGQTLFRGKDKDRYRVVKRDKIYGRALGRGAAEELFDPQVWTNYDVQRINGMLDVASKVILKTSDEMFARRNKISGMENGEIVYVGDGHDLSQVNTTPVNISLFERSIAQWDDAAKALGAANEAIMGENPTAGTPFKLQNLVTAEAHSLHEYRKGKIAAFVGDIYREWIIPQISKDVTSGKKFLSTLDSDEMTSVAESMATNRANSIIVEKILRGETVTRDEQDAMKQATKASFSIGGSKRFIEILKDEMKDAPIDVFVNVAGKQKDMPGMVDKLVNVFRQLIATPEVLDDPRMAKAFNGILEYSGLNPMDFSAPSRVKAQPSETEPVKGLVQTKK